MGPVPQHWLITGTVSNRPSSSHLDMCQHSKTFKLVAFFLISLQKRPEEGTPFTSNKNTHTQTQTPKLQLRTSSSKEQVRPTVLFRAWLKAHPRKTAPRVFPALLPPSSADVGSSGRRVAGLPSSNKKKMSRQASKFRIPNHHA